jgi:citrate lyase subunit gamma (acyl carrier protein)
VKITAPSRAGSIESGDILIMLHPLDKRLEVDLESKVMAQFGAHIKALILTTLKEKGVQCGRVIARDSGALDYTIKSRVHTALVRSMEMEAV